MLNFLKRPSLLLTLPVALIVAAPCLAAETPVTVTQAWARATPPGAETGAAYFTISNKGAQVDAIVAVQSAVATEASVHEMKMANGMMQMRATPNLAIAPKATVSFTPNGYHVMLMGLKTPLREGEHFKLALQLQHAGKIEVDVTVEGFGASQFTHTH